MESKLRALSADLKVDLGLVLRRVELRSSGTASEDELFCQAVKVCAANAALHPDYATLAARMCVEQIHSAVPAQLSEAVKAMPRVSEEYAGLVARLGARIDAAVDHARDGLFDLFGIETLKHSYLIKHKNKPAERPQHAYMRVALQMRCCQPGQDGDRADDATLDRRFAEACEVYDLLSLHKISHATPTLLNSGTVQRQLASCFLLSPDDTIGSLMEVQSDAGRLSAASGGIGICLTPMRGRGALIAGSGGASKGVAPYLALLNSTQNYADQGGTRPGAFAVYMEMWHADIFEFLLMGRNKGPLADQRCNAPDLKYALWVPDLYMAALSREIEEAKEGKSEGHWYLFSPDAAPGLHRAWGEAFEALYCRYVEEKRYTRRVSAMDLFCCWGTTVSENGHPYWMNKDTANRMSNLSHDAPITCSNLCAEITIPCSSSEYGTCALGAVNLAAYVVRRQGALPAYDFAGLVNAAGVLTQNLDNVLQTTRFVGEKSRRSSERHRPIGVGVMGLANVLADLGLAFGSDEAKEVDAALHACLYYGCMRESTALAAQRGSFESFPGSPVSLGQLQPDLSVAAGYLQPGWEEKIESTIKKYKPSEGVALDWGPLREACRRGVRNGYVTSLMPTATSSIIVGVNESFAPFLSMQYTQHTIAGEFVISNRHLLAQLEQAGLWDDTLSARLTESGGSIKDMVEIPSKIRDIFKTAREIDQLVLVEHDAARAPFITQSMSSNRYYDRARMGPMLDMLRLAHKRGLVTSVYYSHFSAAAPVAKCSSCVL